MPNSFGERLQHAWNAFFNKDPTTSYNYDYGISTSFRPDKRRYLGSNDRSIVTTIYNRIAIDVSCIDIEHCRINENGQYAETIDSGLNRALTLDANEDQTGRALIRDIVMSMFDEGCVAVVPTDTTLNPLITGSYDIEKLRVGRITQWYPKHIKTLVYNENSGKKEEIILPKKMVAIIENPLYSIMNEPNSTLQRLIRTLSDLDVSNANNSSGKLDMIIQLPYVVKSQARQDQAEKRRKNIEAQLEGSKYGIAYIDGTERITQLNRAVENNLWTQAKELTSMLYNQLGLTQSIFDGTADEKTQLNYYNSTITPILSAITEEMMRKFLTKTARTQGQAIKFFRDPFKLVSVNELADIADRFTRNEIASPNEIRAIAGWKPSQDAKSDELRNRNINQSDLQVEEDDPSLIEANEGMSKEELDAEIAETERQDEELDELLRFLGGEGEDEEDQEITHYASKYYDPVKAHEYYMRTRQLKGRTSIANLNDRGKEAAKYVKERISTERKSKQESARKSTQNKIDSLREYLRGLSRMQRVKQRDRIKAQIDSIRAENREYREKLKAEYDKKYENELSKMNADAGFRKVTRRRR